MKVAFATTRGSTIDEHFARAGTFAIYEVGRAGHEFIELRQVAVGDIDLAVVETRGLGAAHDDAVGTKIDRLADCRLVYFTEIGGPSAAKLVQRGIMPLKAAEGTSVIATLEALLTAIARHPAPWMRKLLDQEEADESAAS